MQKCHFIDIRPNSLFRSHMFNLRVNFASATPLHKQIRESLEQAIKTGLFAEGQKLPSKRELCVLLSVSSVTVERVLFSLRKQGLIVKVEGKGLFVASQKHLNTTYSNQDDPLMLVSHSQQTGDEV